MTGRQFWGIPEIETYAARTHQKIWLRLEVKNRTNQYTYWYHVEGRPNTGKLFRLRVNEDTYATFRKIEVKNETRIYGKLRSLNWQLGELSDGKLFHWQTTDQLYWMEDHASPIDHGVSLPTTTDSPQTGATQNTGTGQQQEPSPTPEPTNQKPENHNTSPQLPQRNRWSKNSTVHNTLEILESLMDDAPSDGDEDQLPPNRITVQAQIHSEEDETRLNQGLGQQEKPESNTANRQTEPPVAPTSPAQTNPRAKELLDRIDIDLDFFTNLVDKTVIPNSKYGEWGTRMARLQKLKLRIKAEMERIAKGTPSFVGLAPDIIWPSLNFLGPEISDELNKIWMEPCIATSNLLIQKTHELLKKEKDSLYKDLAAYKVVDSDFQQISRFMINKTKDYQPLRERKAPPGGFTWYIRRDGKLVKNPEMNLINSTGEKIPGNRKRPWENSDDANTNARATKRRRVEYKDDRRKTPERNPKRDDDYHYREYRGREDSPSRRHNNPPRRTDREQDYKRTYRKDNLRNTYNQQHPKREGTPDRKRSHNQTDRRDRNDNRKHHTPERTNRRYRTARTDKQDYNSNRNLYRSGNY